MKSKIQAREQARNRVRLHRGIQSMMKRDECEVNLVNPIKLRMKMSNDASKSSEPPNLSEQLRSWAISFHIKRRALTALLQILQSKIGMQSLPKDSRSLLKTPRKIEIIDLGGGKYYHNGVEKTLSRIFSQLSSNLCIQINLNIDGLPLFKSSPTTLWPILANVYGIDKHLIAINALLLFNLHALLN